MRKLFSTLCLLGLLPASLIAIKEPAKPLVVTSFTIVESWVQVLAGKHLVIDNLISSHSETHGYQLSARDARDLRRAQLIVGMSPTLEPWLETWAHANDRQDRLLWLFDDRTSAGTSHKDHLHGNDPHAWTSPAEAKKMIRLLRDRLHQILPGCDLEHAYEEYLKKIDAVDAELRELFADLPADRRSLITQHANLHHFAEYYRLKVAGTILASSSAESGDASARHFSDMLALIRREGIKVIVTDAGQSDAFARRLAEDAGIPPPLSLSFEYLKPMGQVGDTWESMMIHNGRRLHEALQRR